jgi:hypothetical protein
MIGTGIGIPHIDEMTSLAAANLSIFKVIFHGTA